MTDLACNTQRFGIQKGKYCKQNIFSDKFHDRDGQVIEFWQILARVEPAVGPDCGLFLRGRVSKFSEKINLSVALSAVSFIDVADFLPCTT